MTGGRPLFCARLNGPLPSSAPDAAAFANHKPPVVDEPGEGFVANHVQGASYERAERH